MKKHYLSASQQRPDLFLVTACYAANYSISPTANNNKNALHYTGRCLSLCARCRSALTAPLRFALQFPILLALPPFPPVHFALCSAVLLFIPGGLGVLSFQSFQSQRTIGPQLFNSSAISRTAQSVCEIFSDAHRSSALSLSQSNKYST